MGPAARGRLAFPLLLLVVMTAASAMGQTRPFMERLSADRLNADQNDRLAALRSLPTTRDVQIVRINSDMLARGKEIVLPLGDAGSVAIQYASREVKNGRVVSWSGQAANLTTGSTTIIVDEGQVTASIQTANGLYRIRPLGGGLHAFFKVEVQRLPPDDAPPATRDRSDLSDKDVAADDPIASLRSLPTAEEVRIVRINPEALKDDELTIPLIGGGSAIIENSAREYRGDRVVGWSGAAQGAGSGTSVAVVNGDQVTANIQTSDGFYRLRPLGNGLHALIKTDLSRLPPDHPPSFDMLSQELGDKAACRTKSAEDGSITTISVLVAYTPAVKAKIPDIRGFVDLAIKETNISYQNSGIHIRLVASPPAPVAVNFQEKGRLEDDLAAFLKMDKIKQIRQRTKANVAVMIINDDDYCGLASGIMATKETAYAVVYHDCATGNYSFGHEIGHLQGARHNPEVDGTPTPFAYGHGFLNAANKQRTIMSYDCSPPCNAKRMPQWSRPGEWGNRAANNNVRVLNETAACVAAFK